MIDIDTPYSVEACQLELVDGVCGVYIFNDTDVVLQRRDAGSDDTYYMLLSRGKGRLQDTYFTSEAAKRSYLDRLVLPISCYFLREADVLYDDYTDDINLTKLLKIIEELDSL